MCTLSWRREPDGAYEVFFNRDEKKSRSVAEPPRVHGGSDGRFLAPVDPDGGGTWMLANRQGLLVCLLNRWHEESPVLKEPILSRGRLVMDMGGMENVPAVEERLRMVDLRAVRPFTMVGFDLVGERAWNWNGRQLMVERPACPLTSSSFHFEEVAAARTRRFQDLSCSPAARAELLERFHADTDDGPSAFTVRMCRADAQTMSRSEVRVDRQGVTWVYLEEQADLSGEPRRYEATL